MGFVFQLGERPFKDPDEELEKPHGPLEQEYAHHQQYAYDS